MNNNVLKAIFIVFLIFGCFEMFSQDLESVIHFDGRYNSSEKAIVTYLKGKKIKDYKLTIFHSITINESPQDIELFNKTVLNDKLNATQVEEVYYKNELKACYMQFAPKENNSAINRFLLYKADSNSAVLIYMEGETSLEHLIQIFINKK